MMAKSNKEPQKLGIPGLPTKWSVAVQLIGTFGLAVFLVLYYLFAMGPKENKRYDELNTSINELNTSINELNTPINELTEKVKNLAEAVKGNKIMLKENQSIQLEELFTKCVTYKIVDSIIEYKKIQMDYPFLKLQERLENTLIIDTKLAEGLLYDDGSEIVGMLKHKIFKSKIAQNLATWAKEADDEWLIANRDLLNELFRNDILVVIRRENF